MPAIHVACIIQLSLECVAILFPLLPTTIVMGRDKTYTADDIMARDVAFDWVAGLLGVLITSELVHRTRPMCCVRCCSGSPQTTRSRLFGEFPPASVTAAAWLSVQIAVRTTGLLYNILFDCYNEAYWYSRSDMWVGPVECDASWRLVIFRAILLAASLLTFTLCLCCAYMPGAPSHATFPGELSGVAMDGAATSGGERGASAATCSTADAPPATLPDPEAGKGGGKAAPLAPTPSSRGRGVPRLGPRAWLGVLCAFELATVGLTIGLLWELEIRPECECSEQLAGAVWDSPPGCRMPSWADAYEKQPALVASSSSSSSSAAAADGTGYELYDTCDALMADLARASCPSRSYSGGSTGAYSYRFQSYYRPYNRGGGVGGSIDYTMYGARGGYYTGGTPEMVAATEEMAAAPAASDSGQSSAGRRVGNSVSVDTGGGAAAADVPRHSETNVQVAGVDEADVVKTDGSFVYVLHKLPASLVAGGAGSADGGAPSSSHPSSSSYTCASCAVDAVAVLTIVRSWPADDAAAVATLNLAATHGITPHDLYVDGGRLLILGHSYYPGEYTYDEALGCGYGCDPSLLTVRALLFDITDRARPTLLRDAEVEGDYVSSRKVGSAVYVVSQSHAKPSGMLMPSHRDTASSPAAGSTDAAAPPSADALAAMPWGELGSCGRVGHIPLVRGSSLVTVWSLTMSDASRAIASTTVVGRGRNVYASTSALYVASHTYWAGRGTETSVLRFALSGGVATFHGTAVAPGFILNQFAMDERGASDGGDGGGEGGGESGGDGGASFRIATSVQTSWWCRDSGCASAGSEGNHLFTFAVPAAPSSDGSAYERSGELTGLAPGETIYAVRFLAERAYMVTYRQVDPLYVLDLVDAAAPTVLGYLKMPGYSDYLHPFNASHVLGLGRGGTDGGAVLGVKLALFDATDVANPTIGFAVEVGGSGSHSIASDDHKAFLYDAERRLLTLPMRVGVAPSTGTPGGVCTDATASANGWGGPHMLWQGAMVWNVTEVDFAYLGGVSHYDPAGEVFLECPADTYWGCQDETASCGYAGGGRDCATSPVVAVERALYIGDSLVTLSSATLRFDNLTLLSANDATATDGNGNGSLQAEVALSPSVDAQRCGADGVGGDPISGTYPPSECACRCLAPCERSADVGTLLAGAIKNS